MEDGLIAFINDTIMFSILPPITPNTLINIRNYSDPCGKAPNLRCLRVLRTRKHLKFGNFHRGLITNHSKTPQGEEGSFLGYHKTIILDIQEGTPLMTLWPEHLKIDLSAPVHPPFSGHLKMGRKNPQGIEINANNRYLTFGGRPWLPVMGEFHDSRYPNQFWREELLKMKCRWMKCCLFLAVTRTRFGTGRPKTGPGRVENTIFSAPFGMIMPLGLTCSSGQIPLIFPSWSGRPR